MAGMFSDRGSVVVIVVVIVGVIISVRVRKVTAVFSGQKEVAFAPSAVSPVEAVTQTRHAPVRRGGVVALTASVFNTVDPTCMPRTPFTPTSVFWKTRKNVINLKKKQELVGKRVIWFEKVTTICSEIMKVDEFRLLSMNFSSKKKRCKVLIFYDPRVLSKSPKNQPYLIKFGKISNF